MENQTYLVFIRNMHALEDFTVPAQATTSHEAQTSVMTRYPTPAYMVLTAFAAPELQTMLDDAARWPGVASTVQPPLEQLLQRVTASTRLPPLHRNQMPAQAAQTPPTGARLQSRNDVVPGAMANEAKAAQYNAQQVPETTVYTYAKKPAAQTPASPMQGRSVIDVLKALRG
jgi:hypothetical protein